MSYQDIYKDWLKSVSESEKEELLKIIDNDEEQKQRFAIPLAFGTAGMRGTVGLGTFRMNNYTVIRATTGLARFIVSLGQEAMDKGVVISYDTRRFSKEFARIVAKVLSFWKIKAHIFEDVRPVPMCSFAIRELQAIAGVMITASHNPKEYNGYKVYGSDGAQMSIEDTAVVVKYIEEIQDYFSLEVDPIEIGDIKDFDNVSLNDYITVIGSTIDELYYKELDKLQLSPESVKKYGKDLKLVYTPIHGAGYVPVTTVLERMNINVTCVKEQVNPDTEFSTVAIPNPENPATLKLGIELGNKIGADVVIGTDPDCDRMGLAIKNDHNEFILLNGNQIGALLLDYILTRLSESGTLPKNGAIVKTIVTTTLADRIAKEYGVTVFNVLTGFKFIGEKIKEWESSGEYSYIFGYEESFGYLRGTHARDKDAVIASMLTAEMLCYYEEKGIRLYGRLLDIFEKYGYYCEEVTAIAYSGVTAMDDMALAMKNIRAKSITSLANYKVVSTSDYKARITTLADGTKENIDLPTTDALKYSLENEQFVCIRPSGTEPKLKVYVLCYADSLASSKEKAIKLMADIKTYL